MRKYVYLAAFVSLFIAPWQVNAQGVGRSAWMKNVSDLLPGYLCGEKEYFRQCFKVTAQQCQQAAVSATRTCMKKNEKNIPATLRSSDEGAKWGEVIGECVGNTFEVALASRRINTTKCNNVDNWVKQPR